MTACRLFPSIAPHGAEVPASIWNLPFGVWVAIAASVDAHVSEMNEQARGAKQ